ncbi:SMC-Scp complex subunit ScpB [Candidatus Kaiserbacteria bacterium]|nr:SMC-Scp complex subunit ScpB [Candidatus Kaiserbacteria bacterium]
MNPLDLASKIQALLFAEGDSLAIKKIAQLLESELPAVEAALMELSERLKGGPLALILTDKEAALAVSSDAKDTVSSARAKLEEREIGDAGLEVLTILLYEGPSTRADIDYIRGVNSSSTLRTLLLRGLVERSGNPEDGREYIYRPTVELLAHLGSPSQKDLPEYDTIARELSAFKASNDVFKENNNGTGEGI